MAVLSKFEKYVFSKPYRWDIELERNGNRGVLRYVVRGRKPKDVTDEEFRTVAEAVNRASGVLREIDPDYYFKLCTQDGGEYVMEMKLEGDMNYLAGGLALEFLEFAPKIKLLFKWKRVKMLLAGYFLGLLLGAFATYCFLKL
jgi:hypothetical protein